MAARVSMEGMLWALRFVPDSELQGCSSTVHPSHGTVAVAAAMKTRCSGGTPLADSHARRQDCTD